MAVETARSSARHAGGISWVAGLVLALLVLAAAAAPLVASLLGVDPSSVDLMAALEPPSLAHPLGTDELGRDVLTRLLAAGRISIAVGVGGALLAALVGTVVGLLSGYVGGAVDSLLMRLTDLVISLPLLPLLIVLAAVDLGKMGLTLAPELSGIVRIVALVALFNWTTTARIVRSSALSLRTREFVRAAEALGAGTWWVLIRHILPNAVGPLIVATTLSVGNVILLESVLSFLGLGVQPPTPSWGNMLTGAQELLFEAPRLALWPGLMIFATVLACNLLGDGLQVALDPRARIR
ncbi:MAG: ABC transporter permease [Geminicoccaceae bacterium]